MELKIISHDDAFQRAERLIGEMDLERFEGMSPEQKIRVSFALYRFTRHLKSASLRAFHPDWSANRIEQEVRRILIRG